MSDRRPLGTGTDPAAAGHRGTPHDPAPEPRHVTSPVYVARLRAAYAAEDYDTITQLVRELLADAGPLGPAVVAATIREAQEGTD